MIRAVDASEGCFGSQEKGADFGMTERLPIIHAERLMGTEFECGRKKAVR